MNAMSRVGLPACVLFAVLTASLFISCGDDGEGSTGRTGPVQAVVRSDALLFNFSHGGTDWHVHYIGAGMGPQTDSGKWSVNEWFHMSGIQVGSERFIVGHGQTRDIFPKNEYFIQPLHSNGAMGSETDHGQWHNSYESFFGFNVGERGFIFGQDSDGANWFVQRVSSGGVLDAESDTGTWAHYYAAHTPLYVNDQTYLFFQTTQSDDGNYWFITHVSADGTLRDVDDGHWGNFWDQATSYQLSGKTFLVGHKASGDWYIQRINSDGTMGEETARGEWLNYYDTLTTFVSAGRAYLFGLSGDFWFIQELTADGKLGSQTDDGHLGSSDELVVAFSIAPNPNSFRYTIGWDLSKTTGTPARWSPMHDNPWGGATAFGGGAALADIDGDAQHTYDAVLAGIEDRPGAKRFYYRIGFNLDATGSASSWSDAIYSPPISSNQQGGGADIADIDRNGRPDLLLMYVDNPDQTNAFHYIIGWNLDANGTAESWSGDIKGPDLGWSDAGGGVALGDIDGDGCLDLFLLGIDDPSGDNHYWYTVGHKMDTSGHVDGWSPRIALSEPLGISSDGAGAALADINGNGKLDVVLMALYSPTGQNEFWCRVGWDIDINGVASGWTDFVGPQPGQVQSGGGAAIADIDKNGSYDVLLLAIDDPNGTD
jgi:hypothetical protein